MGSHDKRIKLPMVVSRSASAESPDGCEISDELASIDLGGRSIVLVGLDWTRNKDPRIPLGQASLTANLRSCGATVTNLRGAVNSPSLDLDHLCRSILEAAATPQGWADIGIGVYVWNDALVLDLCRRLRVGGFTGRLILGGPQITYSRPGISAHYPHADVFVRGAGERALAAIVASKQPRQLAGVHWRDEIDRADLATSELARLPSPYLNGITNLIENRRFIRWETKRGCAFRCSFCQHRDAGKRSQVEAFTRGRIEREIDLFLAAKVEEIAVLDPIFNDPRSDYLIALDRLIEAGFRGRLSLQCRFEFVNAEFIERCRKLNVILEFGLQTIHPREWKAIQRGNKLAKIEAAIEALHAAKIDFEVSLIYGLPEQTLDSFCKTVDWCLQRRVPTLKAFPLMLLRGTKLDLDRHKWGLHESDDAIPKVIAANSFSTNEHTQMERIAEALIMTQGAHPLSVSGLQLEPLSAIPERWSPTLVVYTGRRAEPQHTQQRRPPVSSSASGDAALGASRE